MFNKKNFLFIFFITVVLKLLTTLPLLANSITVIGTLINIDHQKGVLEISSGRSMTQSALFNDNTAFTDSSGNVVSPYSLIRGDSVELQIPTWGKAASSIRVSGIVSAGELIFINHQKMINSDGEQFYFSPHIKFYVNGLPVQDHKEIQKGIRVFLRIDPETSLAGTLYSVDVRNHLQKRGDANIELTTVMQAPKKSYKKGDSISIEVKGTPGKKVYADIAGIAQQIPLKEKQGGLYWGTYRFTRNNARRTYLVITSEDDKGAVSRTIPTSFDAAVTGPEIIPVNPNSEGVLAGKKPEVFARFISKGSLVNASSIVIKINGRELKSGIERNIGFVTAPLPSLSPGTHKIEIWAGDEAGNITKKSWNFRVR